MLAKFFLIARPMYVLLRKKWLGTTITYETDWNDRAHFGVITTLKKLWGYEI